MLHSASSMLKREHRRVRCGWEDRIMSNGESKIAIFNAALCCGFARALRALFVGDSLPVDCFAYARNDEILRLYL